MLLENLLMLKELENLVKLSIMTAKLPFLAPLVKSLIKLPRNKLYDFIYMMFYGWSEWKIYSITVDSPLESIRLFKKFSKYVFGK